MYVLVEFDVYHIGITVNKSRSYLI